MKFLRFWAERIATLSGIMLNIPYLKRILTILCMRIIFMRCLLWDLIRGLFPLIWHGLLNTITKMNLQQLIPIPKTTADKSNGKNTGLSPYWVSLNNVIYRLINAKSALFMRDFKRNLEITLFWKNVKKGCFGRFGVELYQS